MASKKLIFRKGSATNIRIKNKTEWIATCVRCSRTVVHKDGST